MRSILHSLRNQTEQLKNNIFFEGFQGVLRFPGEGKDHNCPVHVVSRVVWKVEIVLHCFGSILIKIAQMFANISSLFLLRTSSCNLTLINLFEIRFWQILIKQEIKTLSKANKMLPLQKWLGYVSSYPFGHT